MDIYMIWAHEAGNAWVIDTWDADSIHGNGFGWEEAKDKAYEIHGAENVRVIKAVVDFDKVLAAFTPAETTLSIEGTE